MRQALEINEDMGAYYQFLENDFANHLKNFAETPGLLINAIRTIAIPTLKNAIQRSRNPMNIIRMMDELSKMTMSSKSTLSNYLHDKIVDGTYPRSFFVQMKDIDGITQEIIETRNLDRWKTYYLKTSQDLLDNMASTQVTRNFEFLANLTVLFNLFGRQTMDEISSRR